MEKMLKLCICFFVVFSLSACASFSSSIESGKITTTVESAESDLVEIEAVVSNLKEVGWLNQDQVNEAFSNITKAREVLEQIKLAEKVNERVKKEEYLHALVDILIALEQYKQKR